MHSPFKHLPIWIVLIPVSAGISIGLLFFLIFLFQNVDAFSQFGIDPVKFITQIFLFLYLIFFPGWWASIKVIRSYSGVRMVLWLVYIWALPIIAPLSVFLYVRSARTGQAEQGAAANP
jgi:hypothetical protein